MCFTHIVFHFILRLYILLIKHENIFQDHIESEDSIMQSRRVFSSKKRKYTERVSKCNQKEALKKIIFRQLVLGKKDFEEIF